MFKFKKKKKQDDVNNPYGVKKESKFAKFRAKVTSRHFAIERFGINFGLLSFALLVCLGLAYKAQYDYANAIVNNQALYTTQFTTSKSNVNANVIGLYDNKAHTRSFLLMKLSDVSQLPMDANKYQFFMCGEDGHGNYAPVKGSPAGIFYVFGTTGYVGLYLVNNAGFQPQILNVVGRINSPIVDNPNSDDAGDSNFKKYDEFRVRFNPGARVVKTVAALDGKAEPSVSQLYSDMILNRQQKEAKKQLNKDLQKMQIDLNKIHDYEQRLQIYDHVRLPKSPKYIRGDKIVEKKGLYYLKTSHVMPGGYDLDWQNRTIEQGFINGVIKANHLDPSYTGTDVINEMAKKRKNADSGTDPDMSTSIPNDSWRYADGKKVTEATVTGDGSSNDDSSSDSAITKQSQLNNDIQGLESAWSNYISDKEKYQSEDLEILIAMETTYRQANSFSAINDHKSVLKIY